MAKRCPTPHKEGHSNRPAAWAAWRTMSAAGKLTYVYKCRCGKWHLGRKSPEQRKRNARRKR